MLRRIVKARRIKHIVKAKSRDEKRKRTQMDRLPTTTGLDSVPASIDRVNPLGDIAPVACPKCHGEMESATVDESVVILCKSCQGLLIQSQVFAEIVSSRRTQFTGVEATPCPLDQRQLGIKINCPSCAQKMDVHPYHGPGNVVIDSCAKCWLTFLDYSELSSIEKAPGRR